MLEPAGWIRAAWLRKNLATIKLKRERESVILLGVFLALVVSMASNRKTAITQYVDTAAFSCARVE